MSTELFIVIMSIVALNLAALVGGGLGLAVMKLFGNDHGAVDRLPTGDAADTAH